MKTKAALLYSMPGEWRITEVELQTPKDQEILVEMVSAGLCHSEDHIAKNDSPVGKLPINGGHEGAGIVREVGSAVRGIEVGDHVITSFVPECNRCRPCTSGNQNLCDRGADTFNGVMPDGTFRMFDGEIEVGKVGALGTFAEWQVYDECSVVKVRKDVDLDVLALVACGIPTGWGSAVRGVETQPGDIIVVIGVGGLGSGAIQGAKHAGASRIIAVDTNASRESIAAKLGATDFFTSIAEATDLAQSLSNGQGADGAIITVGIITSEVIGEAFAAIRKGGTVAVTAIGKSDAVGIPVNLTELAMYQKRIQGVLFGMGAPRREIQRLVDLYASGDLILDELVTTRYRLEDVNQGYADMNSGLNVRGLIDFTL